MSSPEIGIDGVDMPGLERLQARLKVSPTPKENGVYKSLYIGVETCLSPVFLGGEEICPFERGKGGT